MLLAAVVRSLHKSVQVEEAAALLATLRTAALQFDLPQSLLETVAEAAASILNKTADDGLIAAFIEQAVRPLSSQVTFSLCLGL